MSYHTIPTVPGLEAELLIRFDGSTWVDVTTHLRSFSVEIPEPSSRDLGMWPPGSGVFNLDNRTGVYTPANTSGTYYGDLYPGRHVKYSERSAGVGGVVWYGLIQDYGDRYPQASDGIATISCLQPTVLLSNYRAPAGSAVVGEGETSGARVSRVLTAAGWPLSSTVDSLADVTVQGSDLTDDAISEIDNARRAEMGTFWFEQDFVIFGGRYNLISTSRMTTSQATFGPGGGTDVPYVNEPDLSSGSDMVINSSTRGNVDGASFTYSDAASIAALEATFADSDTGLIGTDDLWAAANAEGTVLLYRLPVWHPRSITLNVGTSATLVLAQLRSRRPMDRITVKVPTPWGVTLSVECWIVGIRHEGSAHSGRLTTYSLRPAGNLDGYDFDVWDTGVWDTSAWAW